VGKNNYQDVFARMDHRTGRVVLNEIFIPTGHLNPVERGCMGFFLRIISGASRR